MTAPTNRRPFGWMSEPEPDPPDFKPAPTVILSAATKYTFQRRAELEVTRQAVEMIKAEARAHPEYRKFAGRLVAKLIGGAHYAFVDVWTE